MSTKLWKAAPLFVLAVFVLAGCATRVRFEAPRAPNMDTAGVQRIAIVPFTTTVGGSVANQIAGHLTSEVTGRIQGTGAFTLVSHGTVQAVQRRGGSIEPYVDALFGGRLTHYASSTTSRQRERRIRRGDTTVVETFTEHTREVEVAFEYYFARARDGTIVGPVRRSGRTSASSEDRNALPSEVALASRIITSQLSHFHRDVAPHTIRVTRVMEREPDRALRPLMNGADQRRRAGDYLGARDAYVSIWNDHRSIPAAINAAILYEAIGDVEGGIFFMEQVFEATRAPRVSQQLALLNREAAELLGLEALDATQTPAERVAAHAIVEARSVIGDGSRVWIHNNAAADHALVNDVIDNMVSDFLRLGFTVVERGLIDLIATEQNLHLDGSINDDDFISIGNMAGAETIIAVAVTGAGAARRLQVRVLDIETGTVRMQSGTGVAWRF
ncbi:MAG: hypothetical protein FWB79_03310 [Treponema sp.]|nr:hypothetical protein [Treponema sp.]